MLKCQENSLKYIIDSTKCEFLDLKYLSPHSSLISYRESSKFRHEWFNLYNELLEHNWFVNRQVNAVR